MFVSVMHLLSLVTDLPTVQYCHRRCR